MVRGKNKKEMRRVEDRKNTLFNSIDWSFIKRLLIVAKKMIAVQRGQNENHSNWMIGEKLNF